MSVDPDKIIRDIETLPVGDGSGELYILEDFQKQFIHGAFREGISRAGLTLGRGGGKTGLLSAIAAVAIIPGLALHKWGFDVAAFAASFLQARILGEGCSNILRLLEIEREYLILDNQHAFRLQHKKTRARFQCLGSSPGRSHGGKWNLMLLDELSQFPPADGPRLWAAIVTTLGKKNDAKVLAIGTRPVSEDHFFAKLLAEKSPSVYSQVHAADPEKDDPFSLTTWRKANPGLDRNMPALSILESEAERARMDSQERSQFMALRCNMGTSDVAISGYLLDPESWRRVEGTPELRGKYILGLDLGGSEAFTAAAAIFETGGIAVLQATGNHRKLSDREKDDGLTPGFYLRMQQEGELIQLGDRVVPPDAFLHAVVARWGKPVAIVCDRFRKAELLDSLAKAEFRVPYLLRGMGFKDGAEDVRIFRRATLDKQITAPQSWAIRSALSGARLIVDPAGNAKLAKNSEGGRKKSHRDDLAAAIILGVAEFARRETRATAAPQEAQILNMNETIPESSQEAEFEVLCI